MGRTLLVVGGGIAGAALARLAARAGWEPTVVELAAGERSSGAPVDVRGPALPVAGRLGVLPALRACATLAATVTVLDDRGRVVGRLPVQPGDGIEVPRADLTAALVAAAREDAAFVFGDTVTALDGDGAGVDVTFAHGRPRRFDLVVGADGLHSRVRALAFGPEERYVRPVGLHVVTAVLRPDDAPGPTVLLHNAPGRMAAVHPVRGRPSAAYVFRTTGDPPAGAGPATVRRWVRAAYAGCRWPVVDRIADVPDAGLWHDRVARVRLPGWSRGRVVLAGDAAGCVSLLGEGSSLALAGAAALADALGDARRPGTPLDAALRAYERRHRPLVRARQRAVPLTAGLLVPATAAGLRARDLLVRGASAGRDMIERTREWRNW